VLVHVLVLVLETERERVLPPIGLAAKEFTVWDTAQTLEQEQDDREAGHALIASSKYHVERSELVTRQNRARARRRVRARVP
jgi:hypothetical protein